MISRKRDKSRRRLLSLRQVIEFHVCISKYRRRRFTDRLKKEIIELRRRNAGVHFRIQVEEIDVQRTGDRDVDIEETTRRIHALFESWIREHPEQWMWAHRRWG